MPAIKFQLYQEQMHRLFMGDHIKPNVWVVTHPDGWAVRHENTSRVAKTFDKQADAIEYGRAMAKREGVELFIQGMDGKIRDRDSHGNDPYPPKG